MLKLPTFATAATLSVLASITFAVAAPAPAFAKDGSAVVAGQTIYGPDGKRIGSIYKVVADGSPQLILNGKMVTVPVATLTSADGKVTTSVSKRDLLKRR